MGKISLFIIVLLSFWMWQCTPKTGQELLCSGNYKAYNNKIKNKYWLKKELWSNPSQSNGQPVILDKKIAEADYNIIAVPVLSFDREVAQYDTLAGVQRYLIHDKKEVIGIIENRNELFGYMFVSFHKRGIKRILGSINLMGASQLPAEMLDFLRVGLTNKCLYFNSTLNFFCYEKNGKTYLFNNRSQVLLEDYIVDQYGTYSNFILKAVLGPARFSYLN
ncbi:MAG TPA: hypothetical protein VF691_18465 [Cytophagaceae bacterium]|jgi:hypothetical protein